MRRKVHGFFYALILLWWVVYWGAARLAGSFAPVCKPDTSSTAMSFAAPDGGLNHSKGVTHEQVSILANRQRTTTPQNPCPFIPNPLSTRYPREPRPAVAACFDSGGVT